MSSIPQPKLSQSKLLIAAGVGALVFLAMTIGMFFRSVQDTNGRLMRMVIYDRPAAWTAIMEFFNAWSASVLVTLSAIALAFLVITKRMREAAFLFLAIAFVPVITLLIKVLLSLDFPGSIADIFELNAMLTYPSDRSIFAAALFSSIALLYLESFGRHKYGGWAVVVCGFLIMLVGVSKIFHARHYPADVIAGISVGVAWACFSKLVVDLINEEQS